MILKQDLFVENASNLNEKKVDNIENRECND